MTALTTETAIEHLNSIKEAARAREDLALFNLAKVTEQIVNTQAGMLNWLQELHGSVNGGPAPTPKASQAAKAVQTMDAIAAMDAADEPNTLVVTLRITADRPIKDKNRMAEVISNRISTLDTVRLVELR